MGYDDYEFTSVDQRNRFEPNKTRRNISFKYSGVFI